MAEDCAAGRPRLLNSGLIGRTAAAVGFDYHPPASPPPSTYRDVLTDDLDQPPVQSTTFLGSIYRQAGGRVAIHWRTHSIASRSGVEFSRLTHHPATVRLNLAQSGSELLPVS